jgi:hypothetical protein
MDRCGDSGLPDGFAMVSPVYTIVFISEFASRACLADCPNDAIVDCARAFAGPAPCCAAKPLRWSRQ